MHPVRYEDPAALADAIIAAVGKTIVLALPLGLGKANHVVNALFARAMADPSITLRIFTALTLEKPRGGSDLERRFLGPITERLFGGYPDLAYVPGRRAGTLPTNIEVNEFFMLAGRWLAAPAAQQDYISANYTHAARYVLDRGVNVVAQLVAPRTVDGEPRYSLSCNPDLTLDLLAARDAGRANFLLVGQTNAELPFMIGDGDLPARQFSHMLDSPATQFPLFAPPKAAVSLTEYAIGFHAARLIRDGGTLQIGIGSVGDAVCQALILRQRENALYRDTVMRLSAVPPEPFEAAPFTSGLYGATEMLVDGFLDLMKHGILSREVDGAVVHAAFFLGPKAFYQALREMPDAARARIRMTPVGFVNELFGDEAGKRRARVDARFVNNAMMATLLGAVVSDGLEDGRIVSGVGGQYNFVAQAFALEDARSIITLNATRVDSHRTLSNIRWSYGHTTIPRHLRDIIVTEYGVADLRGKTDGECVAAMLQVTDSRFQEALLREAKAAGKIDAAYQIPATYRDNTPARIERALAPVRERGLAPSFPFGTDFTPVELRLIPALTQLKAASSSVASLCRLFWRGLRAGTISESQAMCLERLGLHDAATIRDRIQRTLVRAVLAD
ncbi:acetyl-CoA hydrolase/transferase C-terminal domain-containing protein [Reyranella sp. CPCC 100927]|uniref:acetyl-CoA hydrolase/transferase C-terminal domain-containing protein n=1 Tax=Reyranella sp. CPCC 100927 TaxID=2599616 RepID=UPI0011B82CCB|nr:acetyl-CoA hydrolase/transferase C-terminal domain-containing protein [Reyranella sp. CPCC 100927]TWS97044.1 acetyl-CoA hydrolase [Reyranella sp. CPCC 100927]